MSVAEFMVFAKPRMVEINKMECLGACVKFLMRGHTKDLGLE